MDGPQDLQTIREQITDLKERIADLAYAKAENIEKIAEIRQQLTTAGQRAAEFGIPEDEAWRIKANHALRCAGTQDQKYAAQLGEMRSQLKTLNVEAIKAKNDSFGKAFIEAARQLLPRETYCLIRDKANEHRHAAP